ncbi:unnamed protein product [Discosporangium mesarthrocarpum]
MHEGYWGSGHIFWCVAVSFGRFLLCLFVMLVQVRVRVRVRVWVYVCTSAHSMYCFVFRAERGRGGRSQRLQGKPSPMFCLYVRANTVLGACYVSTWGPGSCSFSSPTLNLTTPTLEIYVGLGAMAEDSSIFFVLHTTLALTLT